MICSFLEKEYLVMALINAKTKFLGERFITTSELNQFVSFITKEFNWRNLGIIITSECLNESDFLIINDVIMPTENCSYNLEILPDHILNIMKNKELMLRFFKELEQNRMKSLEKILPKTVEINQRPVPIVLLRKKDG